VNSLINELSAALAAEIAARGFRFQDGICAAVCPHGLKVLKKGRSITKLE